MSGEDLTCNISVLDAKIKCFEWMLQLIARSNTTRSDHPYTSLGLAVKEERRMHKLKNFMSCIR